MRHLSALYNKRNYCIYAHVYLFVWVHRHLFIGLPVMHILNLAFRGHVNYNKICGLKGALYLITERSFIFHRYEITLKDVHSLKIKILHNHLYFISTEYLWNKALVEYIDIWTRSCSLVIIYRNHHKIFLVLSGNL